MITALLVAPIASAADTEDQPNIASIDYCADQFAFALKGAVPIKAVSEQADSVFSAFPEAAEGLPTTTANAEALLAMRPDIVLRQWRGGPAFDTIMQQAGIESFQLGFPQTQEYMLARLQTLADRIGAPKAAGAFIERQRAIINEVNGYKKTNLKAAYMTPSGFTAGKGTSIEALLRMAGFDTLADEYNIHGWMPMPLEAAASKKPDIVVASFFDMNAPVSHWSASAHPHFRSIMQDVPTLYVPSRYLSCGNMFLPNAAQHLRREAIKQGIVAE